MQQTVPTEAPSKEALSAALDIRDHCLAVRIRMLNRILTGVYDDALRPLGLTTGQLNILAVIALRQPVTPAGLCQRLSLDKSTLSRNLDRMENRGWVEVEGGRPHEIRLSERGEELLEAARPCWHHAQEESRQILGLGGVMAISGTANEVWAGRRG